MARSAFITAFAWLLIATGAVAIPVSVISSLMLLAGSHGTANAAFLGGLLVIGGPPATLLAGIGLLRRRPWAYGCALALLVGLAAWNGARILRGSTPERTYTSPGGVPTTVLASHVNHPLHAFAIAVSLGVLAKLLTRSVRAEFSRPGKTPVATAPAPTGTVAPLRAARAVSTGAARDWRVGHQGRDEMFYEERHDGAWQRIRLSGEMLMGRAHHVIYFAAPEAWLQYPEWARHRREEIIARIKSEFRAPDYEYHGDGAAPTPSPARPITAAVVPDAPVALHLPVRPAAIRPAATPSQRRALVVAIAFVLAIAAGTGGLVYHGLTQGRTWLPTKLPSHSRTIHRVSEPGLFWLSLSVYVVVSAGTFGLGAWGTREAGRLGSRRAAPSSGAL